MQPQDLNLDSSEKEVIEFCQKEASGNPCMGVGHEMRLSYGLNLLLSKQQKRILDEQRTYNDKQLFWSRVLAIATIFLASATILLVKFH